MSRTENERGRIITSGSPLKSHSTNQYTLKSGLDGDRRFGEPRKARMSKRKEEQRAYEEAKLGRVLERALAVKNGRFDGFCMDGFCRELRFLKAKGIRL